MPHSDDRCLAVCFECWQTRPLPYPFARASTRDDWMAEHTGHDVRPVDGWPSPGEAFRRAFGDAAATMLGYRDTEGASAGRPRQRRAG